MQGKWFGFIVAVWIIGVFLGSTFENHTGADWGGTTAQTDLEFLMDFSNIIKQSDTYDTVSIPTFNTQYFDTLVKCATWNFEFMQGEVYTMIYWIVIFPMCLIAIVSILYSIYLVVQGLLPW